MTATVGAVVAPTVGLGDAADCPPQEVASTLAAISVTMSGRIQYLRRYAFWARG
ncbi:MAG TPA: hypothetical protein VEP48_08120 [Methylomirabilota bacterium]|nr:hypothetical protein [Methylomirabilota bacterium]